MDKARLDAALVQRGLAASRERARALILSGVVYVNGRRADKASLSVKPQDALEIRGPTHPYVSRGGLKLERAMEVFAVDARDAVAMDIGASTGGFTDVLLRAGARKVYAVDVGYGQLDWRLRNDPRVVVMERTNARHLPMDAFDERPTLCVMDVSFISIRLILPVAAQIMGEAGRFVSLIKPQFEAGRENVGKKGVVRDPTVHRQVLDGLAGFVRTLGWCVTAATHSPVTGPEGNIEFLFDIQPQSRAAACLQSDDFDKIVGQAHQKLVQGLQ